MSPLKLESKMSAKTSRYLSSLIFLSMKHSVFKENLILCQEYSRTEFHLTPRFNIHNKQISLQMLYFNVFCTKIGKTPSSNIFKYNVFKLVLLCNCAIPMLGRQKSVKMSSFCKTFLI